MNVLAMSFPVLVIASLLVLRVDTAQTHVKQSHCPLVLAYDNIQVDGTRYNANILIRTNRPLNGFKLDIELDRDIQLLGNTVGEVSSLDNTHFSIITRKVIEPRPPFSLQIFVKYVSGVIPYITSIKLDGKTICASENTTVNQNNKPSRDFNTPEIRGRINDEDDSIFLPSDNPRSTTTYRPLIRERINDDESIHQSSENTQSTNTRAYSTNRPLIRERSSDDFVNQPSEDRQYMNKRGTSTKRPMSSERHHINDFNNPSENLISTNSRGFTNNRPQIPESNKDDFNQPSRNLVSENNGDFSNNRPLIPEINNDEFILNRPTADIETTNNRGFSINRPMISERNNNGFMKPPTYETRTTTERITSTSRSRYEESNSDDSYDVRVSADRSLSTNRPLYRVIPVSTTVSTTVSTASSRHSLTRSETSGGSNDECGRVHAPASVPLILRGQSTSKGQWPWHIAIYKSDRKTGNLNYQCGGTLISRKTMITAAHCVTHGPFNRAVDANTLRVFVGKYHLKEWSESGLQEKGIAEVIVYPSYNLTAGFVDDIAILQFVTAVQYTSFVRPVCLWQRTKSHINEVENQTGTVVGWGIDENSEISEELMMTTMPVIPYVTCIKSKPDHFIKFLRNTTFCAGFLNGTSACNGDSGGGLLFPTRSRDGSNTWYLRGLVSNSVAKMSEQSYKLVCDPSNYVVFTDVAQYLDWIEPYIRN